MRYVIFLAISLALLCCGGGQPEPANTKGKSAGQGNGAEDSARSQAGIPIGASPLDFVLQSPKRFALGIPEDFFRQDKRGLAGSPNADTCRVRGLAIAGPLLVVSCALQAGESALSKATAARGYVLAAKLSDVLAGSDSVSWEALDVTERLSADDSARIARSLTNRAEGKKKRRKRRRGRRSRSAAPEPIDIVAAYPTGMLYDPLREGVWVGSAVFARSSQTGLLLFDPAGVGTLGATARSKGVAKKKLALPSYRASALALIDDRYLLASTAESKSFLAFDLEGGQDQASIAVNPLYGTDDYLLYQDCTTWRETIIVCSGVRPEAGASNTSDADNPALGEQKEAKRSRRRAKRRAKRRSKRRRNAAASARLPPLLDPATATRGSLQVLRVNARGFPDVRVDLVGYIPAAVRKGAEPSIELGALDSGGPGAITGGGMTLDTETGYMYLLTGDLPEAKLTRLRLRPR